METVRLRFPPSPTGYLHIGGARTALFNWLYAKKHNGKLVLRIEDTDVERSTKDNVTEILDGLQWLGIDWDEGPYNQTEYAEEHRKIAKQLLESGFAYRCFCTKEELEAKKEEARDKKLSLSYDGHCRFNVSDEESRARAENGEPFVIRFKVPRDDEKVTYEDAVFGKEKRSHKDIEDFVVMRSNGLPLYVLSNMVDDHRDRITHVVRGQDHRANTFKQVLMYRALGWDVPLFAHISLTLDPKKRKISKRIHGDAVTVRYYKERGILPWAFCNFIALLGWSSGDDREIFSREELIEAFSLEGLSKANSVFNYDPENSKYFTDPKAVSINSTYIRTMDLETLCPMVEKELKAEGIWDPAYASEKRQWFFDTVDLIRERFFTLKDFVTLGRAFFDDRYPMDEKAWEKNLHKDPRIADWLGELAGPFEALDVFDIERTEEVVRAACEKWDVKAGLVINAIRAAVSGQTVGPGLFELLTAVGQKRVVQRLRDVAKQLYAEEKES